MSTYANAVGCWWGVRVSHVVSSWFVKGPSLPSSQVEAYASKGCSPNLCQGKMELLVMYTMDLVVMQKFMALLMYPMGIYIWNPDI